ncbi:hypothetical protein GWK47_008351 [Chionoecetes opilio]|uniref:Uncharacterized protein n=1 Tax=Chionoecetes opilio TaxID=41210 RepID=A0A8J4Y8V9_CHIOP|nr:hypothetical protein GWK47_008351 [Chionoecetes opilio]
MGDFLQRHPDNACGVSPCLAGTIHAHRNQESEAIAQVGNDKHSGEEFLSLPTVNGSGRLTLRARTSRLRSPSWFTAEWREHPLVSQDTPQHRHGSGEGCPHRRSSEASVADRSSGLALPWKRIALHAPSDRGASAHRARALHGLKSALRAGTPREDYGRNPSGSSTFSWRRPRERLQFPGPRCFHRAMWNGREFTLRSVFLSEVK